MKKIKYSEERFMVILWDLYRKTTNGETIIQYGEFCRNHQITNAMFPILVKHKVLHSEKLRGPGKGKKSNVYTWATIPPNIHMAKKLMDEIKKNSKEANEKYRERKLNEKQLLELPQVPDYEVIDMQPTTMNPVYEIKQGTVDAEDFKKYDIKIPMSETPFIANPVTISTDPPKNENLSLSGMHKPKSQKSISIVWGLISIKW